MRSTAVAGQRRSRGAGSAWAGVVVLLLAWLSVAASAHAGHDIPLHGLWAPAESADPGDWRGQGEPFDPTALKVFPRGPAGAWVALYPRAGEWPAATLIVVVRQPGLESVVFHSPDGGVARASSLRLEGDALAGHGRLAFQVRAPPDAGEALLLRLEPLDGIASAVGFAVQDQATYLREDARWVAFASACFGVMLAMAVVTLFFSFWLRDITFLLHTGYVLSYALIQAIQTGYAFSVLEWTLIAEAPRAWGRTATAVSVILAILFLDRFVALDRHAPRMRRLVLLLGAAVGANVLLGFLPLQPAQALARALINPLLMLAGPAVLASALVAWYHGSRYAGFFLLGWTPLLALTVLDSAQLFGALPGWSWVSGAALAAGSFEALVLSLGLAERTLGVRRDREQAHRLADIDPLTSLLNRRGLERRLDALIAAAERTGEPLTLLFLDLDRFKSLNDNFGHVEGDRALTVLADCLRAETRSRDVIGRYGGEEFLVVLPECDVDLGLQVAERIRQRLERRGIPVDPAGTPLTVSVGLAVRHRGEGVTALIERADQAMYEAKNSGRNWVALASSQPG
ncbi:sensor domain-containing diguanylate cyclase [Rehaibacterium terrae]|uniref:diguanylate cyclase n=1 Tax=Rehaibacterium terrae TaxID=1341696 RepID=A0A7W7Y0T9_9GAMM|nr:diguanylate cyclase [Rehaibacterium terrae]MBB5016016.1 diguanylate cyclase (GGDEF)-like protein [Rehaibacterium terrae]